MHYILGNRVNGLTRIFCDMDRTTADAFHNVFFLKHPNYYEDLTSVYNKMFNQQEFEEDEYSHNVFKSNEQFQSLDLSNVDLRKNLDFINLIKKLADSEFYKVVDIPENVEVWLHESDDGSEWFSEAHRTWY